MTNTHPAVIDNLDDAMRYMLAGNATVTIENADTGNRYTYRLSAPYIDREVSMARDPNKVVFVGLMNGPDNESAYEYMGSIFPAENPHTVKLTRKSRVSEDAPSYKVLNWVLAHAKAQRPLPESVHIWHEGKCGRCGRKLTVPASIALGLGPDCLEAMGLA